MISKGMGVFICRLPIQEKQTKDHKQLTKKEKQANNQPTY